MPFSTYLPERMGTIALAPAGPFVAGSLAELVLVYTAGTFGIDDTGMVKISWRTTSDMSKPQFDKPQAANFTTVEASNGAKLEVWFDRLNVRPYANTLLIRVGRGYLRAGDTLTIRLGDRRQGSPGYRLQTNVEARVEGPPDTLDGHQRSDQQHQLRRDVLVMGAVSRSGLARLMIGNTAERAIDALPCDVLVVKPAHFKSRLGGLLRARPVPPARHKV